MIRLWLELSRMQCTRTGMWCTQPARFEGIPSFSFIFHHLSDRFAVCHLTLPFDHDGENMSMTPPALTVPLHLVLPQPIDFALIGTVSVGHV